jgi:hypothetical protein
LGQRILKHRILAYLLTLSAIAATPAAISQTLPDYAAIIAAPDRSDADRKLDTNRAPAPWLAFIRRVAPLHDLAQPPGHRQHGRVAGLPR